MDKVSIYDRLAYTFSKKGALKNWEVGPIEGDDKDQYEATLKDLRSFVYNKFLSKETFNDPETLKSFIELLDIIDALIPSENSGNNEEP